MLANHEDGKEAKSVNKLSSGKSSRIGETSSTNLSILLRWSATKFCDPLLSQISKSNSWSHNIHLINRGLGFCLLQQVLQSCMVSKHNNMRTKQIRSKLFKCKNNRKKLLLCYGVVCLGNIQCLGGVVDYPWLLVNPLSQNNCQCIIGCITHQLERGRPIGRLNDRSGGESLLEAIKRLFASFIKDEVNILLQQLG